ncbi:MAG: UbiX family flavin prenyltransferase [Thermoprotei archaeon]
MPKLLIGITGASGIAYSLRLLNYCDVISKKYKAIDAILTRSSLKVAKLELGIELVEEIRKYNCIDGIYMEDEIEAPISSSSNLVQYDGVIIPSSINTVAKLANGIQDNLLLRSFYGLLRLRRKIVIVVRETPLSAIDLYNLYKLAKFGAVVLPASPGFYSKPSTIEDLLDFIVGKVFDVLGIPHEIYARWGKTRAMS